MHQFLKVSLSGLKHKYLCLQSRKKWLAGLIICGVVLVPAVAAADTLWSQAYFTSESLPTGAIVSLQKNSTDHINSATTQNSNYLLGVTIASENSEISLSSGQAGQVNVATSGIEQVLVSDINGNISVGDSITSSPVKGVGMKATGNVKVIGVAQQDFPNSSASKQPYKDANGKQETLQLGQVPVSINVSYFYKQPDKTIIPTAIQNIADALAGKKVNTLPILVSIAIFFATLIFVVSIIYSMIHSSIISVGRNPLSQAAVYRNVIHLSGLVVLIIGVAVGSIYMVLAKF